MSAISGSGAASARAGFGFTLCVASVEVQTLGHLFCGVTGAHLRAWGSGHELPAHQPADTVHGDAELCGSNDACEGASSVDRNAFVTGQPGAHGEPFWCGETVHAQAWLRDPPATKTTNFSDRPVFLLAP